MTLFSEAKQKFQLITEGEDIPTHTFLLACTNIVPFFGKYMRVQCSSGPDRSRSGNETTALSLLQMCWDQQHSDQSSQTSMET